MQVNKWIGISSGCALLSAATASAENNQIIIWKICFRNDLRLMENFIAKFKGMRHVG